MRRTSTRKNRAGFTIVELMVALTITAFVIVGIYTMVASSSRQFHEQQRVGQTQLGVRLGLDRVRRDIERAAFHASPDSNIDSPACFTPVRRVVGVQLFEGEATGASAIATMPAGSTNAIETDRLVLTGNYDTSDAYFARHLNATGDTIFLQVEWQGFRRSFASASDPSGNTIDTTLFSQVFAPGRMLLIHTLVDRRFYVTVSASGTVGSSQAWVQFTPSLGVGGCVGGLADGALVAPISQIDYVIRSAPATVAAVDPVVTGANTVLMRRELDIRNGSTLNEYPVLEWAVSFDVDAIVDTAAIGAPPTLAAFDDTAAQTRVTSNPSRVRALAVTIAARTQEQDANFPWVAPVAGAPLARFRVFSDRAGAARVRTASMEIGLPNLIQRGL